MTLVRGWGWVLLLMVACGGTTRTTGAMRGDPTGEGGATEAAGGKATARASGDSAGGGAGGTASNAGGAQGDGETTSSGGTASGGFASGGTGGEPSRKECDELVQAVVRFVDEHDTCSADTDCTVVGDCGPNADFVAVNARFATQAYAMQSARCASSATYDGPLYATRCERGACVLVDTDSCCGCPAIDGGL